MDVPALAWTVVAPTDNDKFIVQNRGNVDIAFLFSATAIADDGDGGNEKPITGDNKDEYGILQAGVGPLTISDLETNGLDMYVRPYGPGAGLLYVQ